MDPQTIDTLVAAVAALCIMLLLYGAWVCLDHLTARDELPRPRARPAQEMEVEPREEEA
jgi:hypothetical protein